LIVSTLELAFRFDAPNLFARKIDFELLEITFRSRHLLWVWCF